MVDLYEGSLIFFSFLVRVLSSITFYVPRWSNRTCGYPARPNSNNTLCLHRNDKHAWLELKENLALHISSSLNFYLFLISLPYIICLYFYPSCFYLWKTSVKWKLNECNICWKNLHTFITAWKWQSIHG